MKCFCILVISVLCHKCRKPDTRKVQDLKGQPLLLFTNDWGVRWASEKNKDLELLEFSKN